MVGAIHENCRRCINNCAVLLPRRKRVQRLSVRRPCRAIHPYTSRCGRYTSGCSFSEPSASPRRSPHFRRISGNPQIVHSQPLHSLSVSRHIYAVGLNYSSAESARDWKRASSVFEPRTAINPIIRVSYTCARGRVRTGYPYCTSWVVNRGFRRSTVQYYSVPSYSWNPTSFVSNLIVHSFCSITRCQHPRSRNLWRNPRFRIPNAITTIPNHINTRSGVPIGERQGRRSRSSVCGASVYDYRSRWRKPVQNNGVWEDLWNQTINVSNLVVHSSRSVNCPQRPRLAD